MSNAMRNTPLERLRHVPTRLGLAVGLDLPFGHARGLMPVTEPNGTHGGAALAPAVARFLARHGDFFVAAFASIQPRRRERLTAALGAAHAPALRAVRESLPRCVLFSLHHTQLDTGQPGPLDPREREGLLAYTSSLALHCGAAWVNEDLGIWTLDHKPLPYPLPPVMSASSRGRCIAHVDALQRALSVPLVVELPGFTDGACFVLGPECPLAFFHDVVMETGSPCTIDTAHLLGLCALRGIQVEDAIARLPLSSCVDIHMSGTTIRDDGTVYDAHHGVLHPAQLSLLERLLPRCPALRTVTYEDPRFLDDGSLVEKARPGFERLAHIVGGWASSPSREAAAPSVDVEGEDERVVYWQGLAPQSPEDDADLARWHRALRDAVLRGVSDDPAARTTHRLYARCVLENRHAGSGSLHEAFARSIAAVIRGHQPLGARAGEARDAVDAADAADADYADVLVALDALATAFIASSPFAAAGGVDQPLVEEAFGCFLAGLHVDPDVVQVEMLRACASVRVVTPEPRFQMPPAFHRAGDRALVARAADTLVAALDLGTPRARLATGPLPLPLVRAVCGERAPTPAEEAALRAHGLPWATHVPR